MTSWEYNSMTLPIALPDSELERHLKTLDAQNWELITAVSGPRKTIRLVCRRAKDSESTDS